VGDVIGLKLIADLITLAGEVKIKRLNVEQKTNKIIVEAEFENEEQAKLVLDVFNKYKNDVGW
jgi:hypothetical protein